MNNNIGDRIKYLRQERLVPSIAVSSNSIRSWESGKADIKYRNLYEILSRAPRVSCEWLVLGEGPVLKALGETAQVWEGGYAIKEASPANLVAEAQAPLAGPLGLVADLQQALAIKDGIIADLRQHIEVLRALLAEKGS